MQRASRSVPHAACHTQHAVPHAACRMLPGSGMHYRVYLGANTGKLCQLNDEDDWTEQFALQKMAQGVPWPKVFAVEVQSEERATMHASAPPPASSPTSFTTPTGMAGSSRMAGEGEQLIITTPAELRQAVKAVTGRHSRDPAGGSGSKAQASSAGKKKAAGKKPAASTQADSSASEEEEELSPVPHMRQLVTKLVEASLKPQFIDTGDNKPRYELVMRVDDGRAEDSSSDAKLSGGQFRSFKPANLSSEHLGQDEALKPGLLFFQCKACSVPTNAMKGKFAIGPEPGRRSVNKEGRPQLKSFSAILGTHDSRKHSSSASPAAKLHKTAAGFMLSAAAAQSAAPFSFNPGPAKAVPSMAAAAAGGLTTPEERGGDVIALRMPFSKPPPASREYALESVLTVNELKAVATDKATVCTGAFDILRRVEFSVMEKRAETEDVQAVSMMVRHVSVYDLQELEKRSCRELSLAERSKKGGVYDKMRDKLGLESLEGCHLVSFGVSKNGHFCEVIWLPQSDDLLHFDSFVPCRLGEVVEVVLKPFLEHCATHSDLPYAQQLTITTKGPDTGIEQQPAGSNACAFSSVLFLGEAIATLFSVLAEAKVEEGLDVPTTLSERLCALEVSAGKYAKKRKGALRDMTELRKEYLEYCATVGSEEAAAAAAAAAEEEGEEDQDSDHSSEEDSEEDKDRDNSSDWDEPVGACMVSEEPEEGHAEEGMEVLQDEELGGYPSDTAAAAGVEEGNKEEGEDEGVEECMSDGPEASQQSDLWSEDEKE